MKKSNSEQLNGVRCATPLTAEFAVKLPKWMRRPLALAALTILLLFASNCPAVERFEVIVLGDTQSYLTNNGQYAANFGAQTDWIGEKEEFRNIQFVSHVGDIVENPGTISEWNQASGFMSTLDNADIPYAVAFGNHETTSGEPGGFPPELGATNYINTFGPSRFAGDAWFGGASSNNLNSWQRFSAGGGQFLHLNLEFDAPDATLAWAQSVIDMPENQGLPTMLTTHVYLNDNRGIFNNGHKTEVRRQTSPYDSSGTARNSAQNIFDDFIYANGQIFLTFNGHMNGERLLISQNADGDDVYQMQVDYSRRPNGGDGWTKILTFDVDRHEIKVSTYSPVLDEFQQVEPDQNLGRDDSPFNLPVDHYTGPGDDQADGDAEYVISLNFFDRFGIGPENPLPWGDLSENGLLDAPDWILFRDNHLTDLSLMTLAETYLRGDVDQDGDNDEQDFALFKQLYDDANGPGSLDALMTSVPEPSSWVLIGMGSVVIHALRGMTKKAR